MAGEGEDRAALEAEIRALNLEARISLPGAVRNTAALYCAAHLSCLPARWEGFPNAIAESLAHGLPAVGFAGCAGTRDLVTHGVNGLLASGNGDPDALAHVLRTAMGDNDLRVQMGAAGVESVNSFAPERIFNQWEQIAEACRDASHPHPLL